MKWFTFSSEEVLSRHNVWMLMVALLLFSTSLWTILLFLFYHHSYIEILMELVQSLGLYVCIYEAYRWSMRWCNQTNASGWKALLISILFQAALYYPLLWAGVESQLWLLRVSGTETVVTYENRVLFSKLLWWMQILYAYLSTHFLKFLLKSREQQLELVQQRAENLEKEASLLRKQLSPHFLFNSLNTLEGLMVPENKKGRQFLNELSNIYRFQLRNASKVSLRDELSFTKSYLYMMQVRFGKALQADIRIPQEWMEMQLPGVSVQLLEENAIKHNALSEETPLQIDISARMKDDDLRICVSNNIIPKEYSYRDRKSGTGLSNLNERYRLLGLPEIAIRKNNQQFTVEISVGGGN